MKTILTVLCFLLSFAAISQKSYQDSLKKYLDNYVKEHGVVKGDDKKHLNFYPISQQYKVTAKVELTPNSTWFKMETSGILKPLYRVFGVATFSINGNEVKLNIYQNKHLMEKPEYADHLFIPFTDVTSGVTTYEGGRYIDIIIQDIKNNTLNIDFNKAYNPYCAYVSGIYSCPIPPKENRLTISIEAGEKNYSKSH